MRNVTMTLPDEIAAWLRVEAAKDGKSVSRYLGDRLAEEMSRGSAQRAALEHWLSAPGWQSVGGPLPTREQIYDRAAVRRHEPADIRPRPERADEKGRGAALAGSDDQR